MTVDVEETIKRLQGHKGVVGVIVTNFDGIHIKSTLDHDKTLQYADLISQLTRKAKSVITALDPQDELTFLKIKSNRHEIMISPDKDFILIVIKDPSQSIKRS